MSHDYPHEIFGYEAYYQMTMDRVPKATKTPEIHVVIQYM